MSCVHCRPLAILRRCRLLLLLFFLLSWASSCSKLGASAQCLPDQSAALLRLKQGFKLSHVGNSSSLLPSWSPGTDCCRRWTGVTCEGASGRVVALDLSRSSISGNLDPALFNLTSLRFLNLSCNQFNPVPMPSRGFEMLRNLTHLNLSDSGFAGQIPIGISRLTALTSLDLSAYNICSTSSLRLQSPDLKALVRDLAHLEELYLHGVNISAGGHEWGRALSSSVPNLRELSLSGCSLSGPIDDSFSHLTSLTLLRLDQNNLSSEVPEFLGNFSSLRLLRLSFCGLNGSLPTSIFKLRFLTSLDVSKNPMLSGRLPDFPDGSVLENLLLFDTNLSGNLPDSIGNLKFLKNLRLSNCNFSGSLPASFGNLTQLVVVDLSVNSFSGPIPSFASSDNLSTLDLQNNSLTGPVPAWVFSLPSLQTLQLNSNQLFGDLGQLSVEASVLETVDLSSNRLRGSIPESVAKLRGVKVLRFASNHLNGTVGLGLFGNLKNLSILDLSNNMLTVETNSSISFPNVSTLNLASCNLAEFPGLLRNQAKLSRLDLSNNGIDGVIPNWIWSVSRVTLAYLNLSHNSLTGFQSPPDFSSSSLNVLDIHSNKLGGSIPPLPPSNLVVDYSNNRFTSAFPSDISSSLNYTIFFSVSNNSLTGLIPDAICSWTYLQVLDLSHNKLTGQIPQCLLAGGNDLRVLNLRGNRLWGSLPREFGEGCKLRTLNLNGNTLEGAVPPFLRRCKMLQVLDLGNNRIEGSFPFWLGHLPELRVLVLRSNSFSGPLPSHPDSNYAFSMLQIMDISSNGFNGTLPSACFRSWKAMTATDGHPGRQVGEFGFLELTHLYYQDTVTVTFKGLEMTLVKILTIFTSIDLSNNTFVGSIPEEVGQLKALYFLNLSSNGLTGRIPSSIGNLVLLESLDLSSNNLSGEIPRGLAALTFLSVLNLSNNKLVGQIPQGGQITTFPSASFEGNKGLCGMPLSKPCSSNTAGGPGPPASKSILELSWEFIFIGLGFGGGLALVIGPFTVWSEGRRWYNKHVDRMLLAVLPPGLWLCSECKDGKVDAEEKAEGGSDTEEEEGDEQRRFCVFCTQLEFREERVTIRHVQCSCPVDE